MSEAWESREYIPESIGEIRDLLGSMMLRAPIFNVTFLTEQSIDSYFRMLDEGLKVVRRKLGEERYAALASRSERMRALFEADPEDKTGETALGRQIITEMEKLLRAPSARKRLPG